MSLIVENLMCFDDFGPLFRFWLRKASFSIGFIRYFDMAKCYIVYSEKGNAFWRFWHLKGGQPSCPIVTIGPSGPDGPMVTISRNPAPPPPRGGGRGVWIIQPDGPVCPDSPDSPDSPDRLQGSRTFKFKCQICLQGSF